ncbi:Glycosyltransferase [Rhodanobacter sp. Root179]
MPSQRHAAMLWQTGTDMVMRIGIVSETYPPEINGVALTVHGFASGLAARGHEIQLVRPRQPQPSRAEPGIDMIELRGASLPRYPGLRFGWPAGRALQRQWTWQRPDVVYVATEGPLGWSAARAARQLDIPLCSGFHTRFDHYASHYGVGLLAPLLRGYLRRFHLRTAATLVPTDTLARELRTMGITNARVLRRAVDTQLFHPGRRDDALRASWGVDAATPVVLYVGRIAAEKNLELAIEAFGAIRRRQPQARYVWVGDGPARPALQAAHPDFIFAGMQRGEALARHVASADLFPFPSLSETFGNVIIEALAAGLPVVAYAQGAAREHLDHGINGYGIESGDAQGFIDATVRLAGNPALIRHMGRAARASVAGLSPEAVIRDFETLLREMAEENLHEHAAVTAHF